jgi:flagellar basal-body rod protein FlgC
VGYMDSLDISASALTAQRLRMDVIAQNIANSSTTRAENGMPYRRKMVVFEEKKGGNDFSGVLSKEASKNNPGNGVRVTAIIEDPTPYKRVYDPGHPDADEEGYVNMPNVDVVVEMLNMISASRAYEANVTALNTSKNMAVKALEIGR